MASRRTIGYIQNEWTCPNCGTRNKGSAKTCENCGSPQPENVQFELPSDQNFVSDEASIKAAEEGPDIHCPFCGTRNPASAKTCSQCGGDLTEGKAREAGRLMQAPPVIGQPNVIKCANCGTENPGTNSVCSNCGSPLPKAIAPARAAMPAGINLGKLKTTKKTSWLLIGGILAALAVCCVVIGALFFFPSKSVKATVTDVHWQTSVPLQEIRAVDHNNEPGSPPRTLITSPAGMTAMTSANRKPSTRATAIQRWWRNVTKRLSSIVLIPSTNGRPSTPIRWRAMTCGPSTRVRTSRAASGSAIDRKISTLHFPHLMVNRKHIRQET